MDLEEPVTLYNPMGGEVTTSTRAEVVRLRAHGYLDEPPFDPSAHKLEEVEKHLTEHPDDAARVVAAEKARGKDARKTIVGGDNVAADGQTGEAGANPT